MYIRHCAFSGEACQFLFMLVVLLKFYEILVRKSMGSLDLGDGPCPEAGHGGRCLRDPTHPHTCCCPPLLRITHCLSGPLESGKQKHFTTGNQKNTKWAKRLPN